MSDTPDTPPPAPDRIGPDLIAPDPTGPDPTGPQWRNFYGRRSGKTMRASQKTYLSEDLSSLTPGGISKDDNPGRDIIDPATIFGSDAPLWLEVGFGGGEHMVHMAAQNPGVNILGCEPFINGVAMLLGKIRIAGVSNVAIWPGDVRDVMEVLPAGCIAKAFLNYPDPWHKRRHHRRRFVTPGYLGALYRILAPGAEFRVATDIPNYMEQALSEAPKAGFALSLHSARPWEDWLSTRYEQKALREGRVPDYATFHKP